MLPALLRQGACRAGRGAVGAVRWASEAAPEEAKGNRLAELEAFLTSKGTTVKELSTGLQQAYTAVAYFNSLSGDELGAERWTRLPVDSVALEQLAAEDEEAPHEFNSAVPLMQVADPEDQLLSIGIHEWDKGGEGKSPTIDVIFCVSPNPKALYGDDVDCAKAWAKVLFPTSSDEEVSSLCVRFLRQFYTVTTASDDDISSEKRTTMLKFWLRVRQEYQAGNLPSSPLPLPWRYLCRAVLLRTVKTPRINRVWKFRLAEDGEWRLSRIDVQRLENRSAIPSTPR